MSNNQSLGDRWMEFRPTKTMTFWSCVAASAATMAIGFGEQRPGHGRQAPGADVDLDRRQDERRYLQRGIARRPHRDELILAHAVSNVNIVCTLLCDSGVPRRLSSSRRVVVADEHPGVRRQGQQAPDRPEQRPGIAARKVGAGGSDVRHEQGITHEDGTVDEVGHVGGRVSRNQ